MIDRSEMEKRFYVSSFDGLRAIGILSIIIYHLYSYRLPGGFLGLDIFLILAGYFMTNRLMTSLSIAIKGSAIRANRFYLND